MTKREEFTKQILQEFYTAQYKAALLGLVIFTGKAIDELIDDVHDYLHTEVKEVIKTKPKAIDRRMF